MERNPAIAFATRIRRVVYMRASILMLLIARVLRDVLLSTLHRSGRVYLQSDTTIGLQRLSISNSNRVAESRAGTRHG